MKPKPAVVLAVDGVKEAFLKRHRKDRNRAKDVWADLVDKQPYLEQDTLLGDAIQGDRWPKRFKPYPNLYRLELVHAFRALYPVLFDQDLDTHVVSIEWVGSHKEYDRLFGYSTS